MKPVVFNSWVCRWVGILVLALVNLAPAFGAEAVSVVAWSPHGAGVGCHFNLGPTGARAWMRGNQFFVMAVDPGSPADGVLRPGDFIVGAGDITFSDKHDSRMVLGNAIGKAESEEGRLALSILRDGDSQVAIVPLPVVGAFSDTWPYDCAKSQRILHEACEYILEAQFPDGAVVTDGGMGTFLSGLLLLASGEARFMDGARRAAYATAVMDIKSLETHNWPMGYGGLLLAEYFLATGDASVLPKLKEIVDHLAMGQMRCGSWGHIGPSEGYGAMNQAGIVCAMAMSLAQECGLEIDRGALDRALAFYGRYAELGAVSYGDHPPSQELPDDNGKNASSAVLCRLNPGWERTGAVFTESVVMSYWLRETGHTGGYFSMIWGPLAAAHSRADAFQVFMDYQSWYYNLSRTWRGALVMLPYYEALTRFDDSTYTEFGGEFTTAGLALAFAVPHRKLRILGAPRSVFGAELSGALQNARSDYQSGLWDSFDAYVQSVRAGTLSAEEVVWLDQLEVAARMRQENTLRVRQEIENNLAEGDAYRAHQQYKALTQCLGGEDATVKALAERFVGGTVEWHKRAGESYYTAWRDVRAFAFQSWLPYGIKAKPLVGEVPPLKPRLWHVLAPTSEASPQGWQSWTNGGAIEGTHRFTLSSTDYSSLRLQLRSDRNAHTEVFLNGTQVANVVRGQRSGYARIELDDDAVGLLKQGSNELRITSTSAGSEGNALDLGLDGVLRERPLAQTPARQISTPLVETAASLRAVLEKARASYGDMPLAIIESNAVPERLRVRDSMDRFAAALALACDDMDAKATGDALESPVAYWRYLAAQALGRGGDASLPLVKQGLAHKDWRVRSACCDALAFINTPDAKALQSTLASLLSDENDWVRTRAASALAVLGTPDVSIAAAVAKAVIDRDDWLRGAALAAIDNVTSNSEMIVAAACDALRVPSTAFNAPGRSLRLLEAHGPRSESTVASLIFFIENPGEGMAADLLGTAMSMLAKVDEEGTLAVPVLARVAAGGYVYDRLRGTPRKVAVDLLAGMGPKAIQAEAVLKSIIATTDEQSQPLRDAASVALAQIGARTE